MHHHGSDRGSLEVHIIRNDPPPADWPQQIEAAQKETTYVIHGRTHPRIRYGQERPSWGASRGPCGDCRVTKGQFHVPGCDIERCPCCKGQAISCGCDRADVEDE